MPTGIINTFKPTRLLSRLVGNRSILVSEYEVVDYHGVTILTFGWN